jgi:hypothetical protein
MSSTKGFAKHIRDDVPLQEKIGETVRAYAKVNDISLPEVLELVRSQEEETKRGCQPNEIYVMARLHELRKLGSKMSVLLDALCAVQQLPGRKVPDVCGRYLS